LAKKQYKKSIDASIQEIDKMNSLLDSLINLSIIHKETENQKIDIENEITNILNQYNQEAKKNQISINIVKNSNCFVIANKNHMHILISNLVSNAIKYNKKGGEIEIVIDS
jgi:two-component system phosphate regulon sensor histidine kinase PhoR